MNNHKVKLLLEDCRSELQKIQILIGSLGVASNPIPYLKKYAVIRASGSIEIAFKQTIADKIEIGSHQQVKNFINKKVRESSINPKLSAIETMLTDFDAKWRARFDEQLALADKSRLRSSLTQLVDARNDFAHGGNPDIEIDKTLGIFEDSVRVIEILDAIVHHDYDSE
jgi:hypothetical protein